MRSAAAHLGSQLILTLAQIDDMSKQAVRCPLDVADFDDHFGPHRMDTGEDQR